MKKLVAFVLSAVAVPLMVSAQGVMLFQDFANPDRLSGGPLDGMWPGSDFTTELWWGTSNDPLSMSLVEGSSTAYLGAANGAGDPGVDGAGLFRYGANGQIQLPGTTQGQVVFVQQRSQGMGGLYAGVGSVWEISLGGGVLPVPGIPSEAIQLTFIPEPSAFALAGLGSAALLIFRRRK